VSHHPDLLPLLKFPEDRVLERPLRDQEQVIPLETMQHLARQLHRTPVAGRRRVAVIPEAQRMCAGQAEAANAFLKTLEEPPASSFVILTSSRPEALLETILSRVQPIRLRRLSAEAVRAGLTQAAPSASEEDRQLAVAMSDGSLGRARELLDGDLGRWRTAVLKGLRGFDRRSCPAAGLALWELAREEGTRLYQAAQSGGAAEAAAETEAEEEPEGAAGEDARKTEAVWQRYVFQRLLQLCEAAFRDGLLAAAGVDAGAMLVLSGPEAPLAGKLAREFGAAGCERVLETLREALLAVRLYVRGDLVARVLAGRMVESLTA
jgi:hypothetical protein